MNHAQRIQARAVRRAGELLEAMESGRGNNQHGVVAHTTRTEAAAKAGMSKHQQVQATRVARVPESEFESQVESESPPTVTMLAEQGISKSAYRNTHQATAGINVAFRSITKDDPRAIAAGLMQHEARPALDRAQALRDRLEDLLAPVRLHGAGKVRWPEKRKPPPAGEYRWGRRCPGSWG